MGGGAFFTSALRGVTCEEASALAGILEVSLPAAGDGLLGDSGKGLLWEQMSYDGSNDFAYMARGGVGVSYPEIVRDVCKFQKVQMIRDGETASAVRSNELALLNKIFSDMWMAMTDEEKRALLSATGLDAGKGMVAAPMLALGLAAGEIGGFATYQVSLIIANTIARALLGRGLYLATNAAITRSLGVFLGPVGWIASGAWLAVSLAGPAYRKTVPAVVQVAALRQLGENRVTIGIVGRGSAGKDSLIKQVFGFGGRKIDILPGSTSKIEIIPIPGNPRIRVVNFPGFGDMSKAVDGTTWEAIANCTDILYVLDAGAGIVQAEEVERFAAVRARCRSMAVVLNKCDKEIPRNLEKLVTESSKRLSLSEVPILCSFAEPDEQVRPYPSGADKVRAHLNAVVEAKQQPSIFPDVTQPNVRKDWD